MFFESIGRFIFSKLSPQLIYILLLLPLIFSGIIIFQKMHQLENFELRYREAILKGKKALKRKEKKEQFLHRYANSTPFFLDHNIESLQFLQNEKKELSDFSQHPALFDKGSIQERIDFIKGEANRLSFTEEAIRNSSQVKETEEKQRHSVQMDESDFKKLLSLIEDVPLDSNLPLPDSPQMIITDLILKKSAKILNREILEVEMKILKREFNP